jgi:hypothetical protein
MAHGNIGALAPSERLSGRNDWQEVGSVPDANVRRLWLRNHLDIPITSAGLTSTTVLVGANRGVGGVGVPAKRFTQAADGLVRTVETSEIVAVATS